jgi:hypothetical protein
LPCRHPTDLDALIAPLLDYRASTVERESRCVPQSEENHEGAAERLRIVMVGLVHRNKETKCLLH